MNLITLTTLLLPLLAPAVTAATQKCSTEYGSKQIKGPVPTSSTTLTAPPTTQTVHAVSVAKRDGSTVTVVITSTVRKFAPTATVTDLFTSILTSTTTSTATSFVTLPTTVAAPSGFNDIDNTINGQIGFRRRAIGHPHGPRVLKERALPALNGAAVFPTQVICTVTVPNPSQVTDVVVPGPQTITQVTTVTVGEGFHTNTFNTLIYTTTTTTSTTTSTSIIYSPTTYAACNNQNAYGPSFQNGGFTYYFTNVLNNGPGAADSYHDVPNGASSAWECCQACFAYGTCETYMFRQQNQNCVLLTHSGETCNSQSQHPNIILSSLTSSAGAAYVVGNGPCGYAYSGNSDGSLFPANA